MRLCGHEKTLLVRPDRICDLVLSLPVAAELKLFYPHLTVHLLVPKQNGHPHRIKSCKTSERMELISADAFCGFALEIINS